MVAMEIINITTRLCNLKLSMSLLLFINNNFPYPNFIYKKISVFIPSNPAKIQGLAECLVTFKISAREASLPKCK